jgi:hypothetical protein
MPQNVRSILGKNEGRIKLSQEKHRSTLNQSIIDNINRTMFMQIHNLIRHKDELSDPEVDNGHFDFIDDSNLSLRKTVFKPPTIMKTSRDDSYMISASKKENFSIGRKLLCFLELSKHLISLDATADLHNTYDFQHGMQESQMYHLQIRELLYSLSVVYCSLRENNKDKIVVFYRELLKKVSQTDDLISCFAYLEYFRQSDDLSSSRSYTVSIALQATQKFVS